MNDMTKKRFKAILIDSCVSTAVSLGIEYFLRKKIKNEAVHSIVTPMITQYALEYGQLKATGQTIGYRVMGLELISADSNYLTSKQIIKRMAYRDTKSTIDYLRDQDNFEKSEGAILPHDTAAETMVKETSTVN